MGNLEKWDGWTYLQGGNRDPDVASTLVDTQQGKESVGRTEKVAVIHTHYRV